MKKAILIILGILVVFGLFYLNIKGKKEKPTAVTLEKLERGTIKAIVTASGHVQPATVVDISSDVGGRIMSIKAREGDTVKAGQTLVILDNAQYRTQVDQLDATLESAKASVRLAEAKLQQAKDELERKRALYNKGSVSEEAVKNLEVALKVSQAEYESAKLNVQRAEASLEAAADSYGKTTIKSPMNGVVSQLLMEVGEMMITGMTNISGTVVMRVADLTVMEAEVEVDEADVIDIKVGQEAKITVEALPDTNFKGRISEISNTATIRAAGTSEEVTSFDLKITILDSIPGLRPGMTTNVDIITDTAANALKVPIQAVVMRDTNTENQAWVKKTTKRTKPGSKTKTESKTSDTIKDSTNKETEDDKAKEIEGIYVLQDGRAKFIPVKTGIADERNIQLLTELDDKVQVVTGNYNVLRKLKSGDAIEAADKAKKSKKSKDEPKNDN